MALQIYSSLAVKMCRCISLNAIYLWQLQLENTTIYLSALSSVRINNRHVEYFKLVCIIRNINEQLAASCNYLLIVPEGPHMSDILNNCHRILMTVTLCTCRT
jgi:hypothetical protein